MRGRKPTKRQKALPDACWTPNLVVKTLHEGSYIEHRGVKGENYRMSCNFGA